MILITLDIFYFLCFGAVHVHELLPYQTSMRTAENTLDRSGIKSVKGSLITDHSGFAKWLDLDEVAATVCGREIVFHPSYIADMWGRWEIKPANPINILTHTVCSIECYSNRKKAKVQKHIFFH
jgi:hypothetical protein